MLGQQQLPRVQRRHRIGVIQAERVRPVLGAARGEHLHPPHRAACRRAAAAACRRAAVAATRSHAAAARRRAASAASAVTPAAVAAAARRRYRRQWRAPVGKGVAIRRQLGRRLTSRAEQERPGRLRRRCRLHAQRVATAAAAAAAAAAIASCRSCHSRARGEFLLLLLLHLLLKRTERRGGGRHGSGSLGRR